MGQRKVAADESPVDDAQQRAHEMLDAAKREVDGLRELRSKFTRLYNEVRVRANGLQNLDSQLKAATDILGNVLAKYPEPNGPGLDKETDDAATDAGTSEAGGDAADS